MKKLTTTSIVFITAIFLSTLLYAATKTVKEVNEKGEGIPDKKTTYSIEETTEIMRSKKLGDIRLDHDDHVYKCMKISKEGKDLEGAVAALISFKTNFGYTLDDDEVQIIIRISKLDTNLYNDIAITSKKIGKKKTTVNENFTVVQEMEKGNGKHLLIGMERATQCGYKIENDYFSWKRLNLLIQVGKLENEDRFMDIYTAMKSVGMGSKVNSVGLEVLYKLYHLKGDVAAKIADYLKVNKWKSRKQPGKREYQVIADLMKANYSNYALGEDEEKKKVTPSKNEESSIAEVKPKQSVAAKKQTTPKKKKVTRRKRSKKTAAKSTQSTTTKKKTNNKMLKPCSPTISK